MQFATFAKQVALRLGVSQAVVSERLRALGRQAVHSLAAEGERALDDALDALIARGVDDVAKLLAHGPHEQVRAAMAPEQVSPPGSERATLNGYPPDVEHRWDRQRAAEEADAAAPAEASASAEDLPANDAAQD